MPTSRPFAYNTGSTLSNTAQYGNIAVLTGTTLPSGVQWWNGPDEDIGYVITSQNTSGNQPNPLGIPAYIQFNRTTSLNSTQFISLANLITGQNFNSVVEAEIYLKTNGYWTSVSETFQSIVAGSESSLAFNSQGVLYSWGGNTVGQIGDNSILAQCTPVAVCGNLTFTQVSVGQYHSLGIATNGTTYAWGYNNNGQLGNNTSSFGTNVSTPVAVCGGLSFCLVSAGLSHSLGITTSGIAYAWGSSSSGALGNNTEFSANKSTPVAVCGGLTFSKISAGNSFSVGLTTNGIAYAWGNNISGQLGDNTISNKSTPVAVCGGLTFSEISAKNDFVLALTNSGLAYGWGNNLFGTLGNNSSSNALTPVAVCGGYTFREISAGYNHSLAITNTNVAYAWGSNLYGMLGNNTTTSYSTPIAVCGGITFTSIDAGNGFSVGISSIGYSYSWGLNDAGQLGINQSNIFYSPKRSISNFTLNNVFSAGNTSFGLSGNTLYGWGIGSFGRIGNNSETNQCTPVAVCGALTFTKVSGLGSFALGLTSSGIAYGWGINTFGGIGNNTSLDFSTPVAVCGGFTFCDITAVGDSGLAILSSTGVAYAWGDNQFGQLGNNAILERSTPVAVCGGLSYSKVSGGYYFAAALTRTGLAYAWGDNTYGQLGNNTSIGRSTPVAVCGGLTFSDIVCGFNHVLARTTSGVLYGWGDNTNGQLGNNLSFEQRSTPIAVCGGLTFTQIRAIENSSYGLTSTGVAYAWGSNSSGQLGLGDVNNRSTPTAIPTGSITFCKIIAGRLYAMGLTSTGVCYGWGDNTSGQLGFSSQLSVLTPIIISQS